MRVREKGWRTVEGVFAGPGTETGGRIAFIAYCTLREVFQRACKRSSEESGCDSEESE